jgi:phenylalanyl-tRNA synthetase beta chain
VARIYGYERIPSTLPTGELRSVDLPVSHCLEQRARDSLCAAGLLETVNLPFIPATDLDRLQLPPNDRRRRVVEVRNPFVEEQRYLRRMVLPTLLAVARRNRTRQVEAVRIFEVSRVFRARKGEELPEEPLHAGALILRGGQPGLWQSKGPPPLFHEAKGVVERLLEDLGHVATFSAANLEPFLHPHAACRVRAGEIELGFVGEIHPGTATQFEIGDPCAVLEVDLGALASLRARARRFRGVSRQPLVRRDLSVLVDEETPAGELMDAIRDAGGSILVEVDIFDRYVGRGMPAGKVSLAFRLVFQRTDRALKDSEVAKQTERIVQVLAGRFGATLR